MNKILYLLLFTPFFLQAQDAIDPAAKLILDEISKKLNSSEAISLEFDLTIQFPGMDEDGQKGKLVQSGDKFKVNVGSQEILSNSKDVYIIDKESSSAQLNSAAELEEGQGLMNPKKLFTMYDSGDYFYAITGEDKIDNAIVNLIEFKPKDRYSEYSKLRMAVRKSDNQPVYLTLFNKDGSRFTITLNEIQYINTLGDDYFEFTKDKYSGIIVEDLRID